MFQQDVLLVIRQVNLRAIHLESRQVHHLVNRLVNHPDSLRQYRLVDLQVCLQVFLRESLLVCQLVLQHLNQVVILRANPVIVPAQSQPLFQLENHQVDRVQNQQVFLLTTHLVFHQVFLRHIHLHWHRLGYRVNNLVGYQRNSRVVSQRSNLLGSLQFSQVDNQRNNLLVNQRSDQVDSQL